MNRFPTRRAIAACALASLGVHATAALAAPGDVQLVGSVIPSGADTQDYPSISGDGRFVAFTSRDPGVIGNSSIGHTSAKVFVRDMQTQALQQISTDVVDPSWTIADGNWQYVQPAISADGNTVIYAAVNNNNVNFWLYDRLTNTNEVIYTSIASVQSAKRETRRPLIDLSADGRYAAICNGGTIVYFFDRAVGTLLNISQGSGPISSQDTCEQPDITPDGGYVAYVSHTSLLPDDRNFTPTTYRGLGPDVYVWERADFGLERVSVGSDGLAGLGWSISPSISDDGRFVAFASQSQFVATGHSGYDIYVRDRLNQVTELVSPAASNLGDAFPHLSADGRIVTLISQSALLPDDTNGVADIYAYDRQTRATQRLSAHSDGTQPDGASTFATVSADGRHALFSSSATNLTSSPTAGANVFVKELGAPTTSSVWRSQDVHLVGSSPQASVKSFDGTTAALEFYESIDDGGVAKDFLFGSFTGAAHPEGFNHLAKYWFDSPYPYAGKSNIGRGADSAESNAETPRGVLDLQLHPADNSHLTVAAFVVPEDGRYSVSHLAVRRVDANGTTVRLRVFDSQGLEITDLRAHNDRAWVRSPDTYELGDLTAGDYIYFGVDADGDFSFDATEIAWEIQKQPRAANQRTWDSYDDDDLLPIEYYESTDAGGVAPGTPFAVITNSAHPEGFNHLALVNSAGNLYPYAGRSSIPRGADSGESNTPSPALVTDMQLHPPANEHSTVAAFHVTQSGTYSVSGLAVRRVSGNGDTVRLKLVNSQGVELANLRAYNDQAWVRSSQTYNLGALDIGDSIYFAVDADGDFYFDATEIAWQISATVTP